MAYNKQNKICMRCFITKIVKTLGSLKHPLCSKDCRWFEKHDQFKHVLHMPGTKPQGYWNVDALALVCEEKKKKVGSG